MAKLVKPAPKKKDKKIKLCKQCDKKVFGNLSVCFSHYKERERLKREENELKKKERKESTKKFQESERKKLHKQAWKLMSEWIRRKDANLDGFVSCYTCGDVAHYKEVDAGHFRHDRLDFDERNLKVQCSKCNRHLSGNLGIYAIKLVNEFGVEWLNQLDRDANAYNKYTPEILKEIIADLQKKISALNQLNY